MKLDQISAPLLSEIKRELLNSSDSNRVDRRSGSTVNRYFAALSSVMTFGRKELHWLQSNPVSDVSRCEENPSRERFLTDDERDRLLAACRSIDQQLYEFTLFALTSAARAGEIQKLKWEDIDFDEGMAELKETKNGSSRRVPVVGEISDLLKQRRGIGNVFVSANGRPYQYSKPFKSALLSAGIEDARFHDLRRSAGSWLVQQGWTRDMVGQLLGHKSLQATQIYTRFETDEVARQAGEALVKRFQS